MRTARGGRLSAAGFAAGGAAAPVQRLRAPDGRQAAPASPPPLPAPASPTDRRRRSNRAPTRRRRFGRRATRADSVSLSTVSVNGSGACHASEPATGATTNRSHCRPGSSRGLAARRRGARTPCGRPPSTTAIARRLACVVTATGEPPLTSARRKDRSRRRATRQRRCVCHPATTRARAQRQAARRRAAFGCRPSGVITQMRSRYETAMCLPSGAQAGSCRPLVGVCPRLATWRSAHAVTTAKTFRRFPRSAVCILPVALRRLSCARVRR